MKNILIVEHNDDLRYDLVKIVKKELPDWKLYVRFTLEEAKSCIDTININIVITDMRLDHVRSKLDGMEIASYLRERDKKAKIIVVTSYLEDFLINNDLLEFQKTDIELLDRTSPHFTKLLELYIRKASFAFEHDSPEHDFRYIWEMFEANEKLSHWILITSGMDIETDKKLMLELALWEKSIAKFETRSLICVPNDEFSSRLCMKFDVNDYPVLIVSSSQSMEPNIKIGSRILGKLSNTQDGIRKLLLNIHSQLKRGDSFNTVKLKVKSREFWEFVKSEMGDIKDFKELMDFVK